MFEFIRLDIARYSPSKSDINSSIIGKIEHYIFAYGLHSVIVYRYGQWIKRTFKSPFLLPIKFIMLLTYKLGAATVRKFYDIHLSNHAEIGPGSRIGHFGGIRVAKCSIGANCSIQQQVRIGPISENVEGSPIIGCNVWIGAHSTITGQINIGDGATVAAGSVVTKDVCSRCLVAGRPSRVINRDYDNFRILNTE